MPGTIAAATSILPSTAPAPSQVEHAQGNGKNFVVLASQLALLSAVMHAFRLGQDRGADMSIPYLIDAAFVLFAVHYWLPFRMKETFWVAASVGAAFIWLDWRIATLVVLVGLGAFAVVRSPLSYWTKVALIASGFAAATFLSLHPEGTREVSESLTSITPPQGIWAAFGSLFMFRMIVYLHDLKHMKEPPSFRAFLAYFFLLPNYIFPLMPVVDYNTMRMSYYRRDGHKIVQQGIHWMCRGIVQLIVYRIAFHLRDVLYTSGVDTAGSLLSYMLLTFLLYTRVSGQFHLAIGLLHLFGYDLPETNRNWMLASSFTDYWRRVNIYWKDFMVKLVYFPVFFRLRKSGQLRAKLVGTLAVFLVTWLLHSYQYFWLRGEVLLTAVDATFWTVFGVLVTINIWWEHRREQRGKRTVKSPWWAQALSTAGTMSVIVVLWSLWEAPSFGEWFDLLTWWS